jgi:hypothetical protein
MSVLDLIPIWFVLALATPTILAVGGAYRRAKGRRAVICPQTSQSVMIELDARDAALMHAAGDRLRKIGSCTLWPERQACGRQCLAHVSATPTRR